ncbi:MAG: hypothetical protein ACI9BD_000180 [Candidatus Marinamargulisbacteria bacterium]|jgi:hypothetical protein
MGRLVLMLFILPYLAIPSEAKLKKNAGISNAIKSIQGQKKAVSRKKKF